ncbi:hypothetical protein ACFQY7_47430 [Actinomadura luteofluorescens]|uniref:hypothetical protein n=1 Tax=Actinomadura luteofluorescens TaxID=46163 RepID=UPI003636429F
MGAGRVLARREEARKAVAYAECLAMLERVLQLWDKVPDAAERIGADHVSVLEDAANAADLAGEFDRGIKLTTAALKEVEAAAGERDTARWAALLEQRGRMLYHVARPGFIEDLRAAVDALQPTRRPSCAPGPCPRWATTCASPPPWTRPARRRWSPCPSRAPSATPSRRPRR